MRILKFISLLVFALIAMPISAQETAKNTAATIPIDENMLALDISTGGRVVIKLFPELAPKHVERIKILARRGFYDGIIFHRVIEGFMAQTGDPTGTGSSGSDLPDLKAEFNGFPHMRGTVSMARTSEEDTANSQFFIVFQPRFSLDREYTNFGRVMSGMQYVDTILRGEPPANPSYIVQASIVADKKPLPNFAALTSIPQKSPPADAPPASAAPTSSASTTDAAK